MNASVPNDILLMIFEQLVCVEDAEDDDEWPAIVYNRRIAQAPFIVSAVCRRWRKLSLSTSTLWTYFGFPESINMNKHDVQRLNLLQDRVGNAPIDVVLRWYHEEMGSEYIYDLFYLVLDAILGLHLQWKTAVLEVPGTENRTWTREAFQSPQWPLLESLSLITDDEELSVPVASRLRLMWLDCSRSGSKVHLILGGYPALTMLGIDCHSEPIIRGLAPNFGRQLVELALLDDIDESVHEKIALGRGVFSRLQSLTLDDLRWLEQIEAPSLKKLVTTHRYSIDVDTEALRRFDHVCELQLCGEFKLHETIVLQDVCNITTLSLDCPSTLATAFKQRNQSHRFNSAVLRELTGFEPPIWPHLQHLTFGESLYHSNGNEQAARDVLFFVSARNVRTAQSDESATARIIRVVANHPGAPEWLEGSLRELISE